MRGHQSIFNYRLKRFNPGCVFVYLLENEMSYDLFFTDPENALMLGCHANIDISPSDVIEKLDFRCLYGLRVHLMASENGFKHQAVLEQLKRFKPAEIITVKAGELFCWSPNQSIEKERMHA